MLKAKGLSPCAMVLAAGLGTRMRPLTDNLPKPLIPLKGKPLIDHVIGRLAQAGAECVAVNLHYHADRLEAHLKPREIPRMIFSDERAQILDSGGGAKKMLPYVEHKPFLLANSDTVWMERGTDNAARLVETWNSEEMDILLLLATKKTSIGYEGKGDFFCASDGKLMRRGAHDIAPYVYAGFAILKPELFADTPDTPFSLNLLFDRAIEKQRLYGARLNGVWMHVGTPESLRESEQLMTSAV